jgi:hypothetical protein
MIVRSALPWPLRWAAFALGLGFSAALALWAFEFGKDIAGIDPGAKKELAALREQVSTLKEERDRAISIASSADSLLKAERTTQATLAQQLKQAESDNLALKADLGFFERILPPPSGAQVVAVRGLQADVDSPGVLRVQVLVMKSAAERFDFAGRIDIAATGTLAGKPWSLPADKASEPLRLKQMLRVDKRLEIPAQAMVKTVQLRILDAQGVVKASQNLAL